MSIWEAIILGIIQGLTEFLPVSSSGHIELGKAFLGVEPADPLLFSVVVHVATALSTVVVFRKDILGLFSGLLRKNSRDSLRYLICIAISMIPAVIAGLYFADAIEAMFSGNVVFVGSMLIVTAVLLLAVEFLPQGNKGITYSSSLIVGIAQAIAITPGISRSGATISTALILGIGRTEAARFSFLMVVPLILGKMSKDILDQKISPDPELFLPLVAGFITSFVVGLFACKWMITIVKKSKLIYFAIYCLIAGGISLALHYF